MEIGMFTPGVPALLEFHKRVQEKKVTCNVRRFDRPLVDVARISLLAINYFELGHYQILVPYWNRVGAFRDPTHVRFFTYRTFDHFTKNSKFPNYYSKARVIYEDTWLRIFSARHLEMRLIVKKINKRAMKLLRKNI